MPTIVDSPEVVKRGVQTFESLFENEPERRHLAEYLTGLIIAEHKTPAASTVSLCRRPINLV